MKFQHFLAGMETEELNRGVHSDRTICTFSCCFGETDILYLLCVSFTRKCTHRYEALDLNDLLDFLGKRY